MTNYEASILSILEIATKAQKPLSKNSDANKINDSDLEQIDLSYIYSVKIIQNNKGQTVCGANRI